MPTWTIILNGGITQLEQAAAHLEHVDGVMLGREAYHNPYVLAGVDARFFADTHPVAGRAVIVERMLPYIERGTECGHRTQT